MALLWLFVSLLVRTALIVSSPAPALALKVDFNAPVARLAVSEAPPATKHLCGPPSVSASSGGGDARIAAIATETVNVTSVDLLPDGIVRTMGRCVPLPGAPAVEKRQQQTVRSPLPDGRKPGDECHTPCVTYCTDGTDTSLVPDDCQVIHDRFFTRLDQTFSLPAKQFVMYTFKSCATSMTNQIAGGPGPTPLSYCYRDWAGVGHWLSFHCDKDMDAHGGICVADYGSFVNVPDWYIQVFKNEG